VYHLPYGITCHQTQVNTPRLNPRQRPVLDLSTPEGWKLSYHYYDDCGTIRVKGRIYCHEVDHNLLFVRKWC